MRKKGRTILKEFMRAVLMVCMVVGVMLVPRWEVWAEESTTYGTQIATGSCGATKNDSITWTVYDSDKDESGDTLVFSGNGEMADFEGSEMVPWKSYKDQLTKIIFEGNQITSIGDYAFWSCGKLSSIEIPEKVTNIGDYAFDYCRSLSSIEIPEGVISIGAAAFDGCSGLTEVTIPEGVTSIGAYAFGGCSGLTEVTIPEGVTSIGDGTFSGCNGLTEVTISEGVTHIGNDAFYGCTSLTNIIIPDSVTNIGYHAFGECTNLTSVIMSKNITSMGFCAFSKCENLTNVIFQDGITIIGEQAFQNCNKITDVTLPKSIKSIGEQAFMSCISLTSIIIPENVESLGSYAFSGCDSLKEVYYPAKLSDSLSAASVTDNQLQVSYVVNEDNTIELTIINIPDDMTSINLPERISGKPISAISYAGGVSDSDISLSCTKHFSNSVSKIDETNHYFSGCSICGITEEIEEAHEFGDGTQACRCGYVPFIIETQPSGENLVYGYGEGTKLSVSISSTYEGGSINYQWYENNKEIENATEEIYVVPVGKNASDYKYYCKISCGEYAIKSEIATVSIAKAEAEIAIEDGKGDITLKYSEKPIALDGVTKTGDGTLVYTVAEGNDVISVSEDGKVTTLKPGTAVISVEMAATENCEAAETKLINVTVEQAETEIIIEEGKEAVTLEYGEEPVSLEGITKNGDGTLVYKVTEGNDVISVSEDGKVTTLKLGTAKVSVDMAETTNYKKAETKTITIKVMTDYPATTPDTPVAVENTVKKVSDVSLPEKWQWSVEDAKKTLPAGEKLEVTAEYVGEDKEYYHITSQKVTISRAACGEKSDILYTGEGEKAPTCTTDGKGHKECTICGDVLESGISVKALGHKLSKVEKVKADCTTDGKEEHWSCSECTKVFSDEQGTKEVTEDSLIIPATGHTGGTATCTKKAVCDVCHKEYGDLDKTNHGETEIKNTKSATCEEAGYTGDTYCKDCSEKLSSGEVIPALGHTGGTATCTKKAVCDTCHEEYGEPNKTNHGETEIKNTKSATCKEAGYTGDTCCKDCGAKLSSGEEIAKSTTHTWNEGEVTKEATTTEKGIKTYTCTVCGETKTEEIPVLEITGTPGNSTPDVPGEKPSQTPTPSVTETPSLTPTPSVTEAPSQTPTPSKTPTPTAKAAPKKGTILTDAKGKAKYKVVVSNVKNGTVEYVKSTNKNATTITIPSKVTMNGITYKVVSIAKNAFKNNKKMTKVTIGSNVKTIGANAFYGCKKLKTVKMGKNITTIGDKAFYKCTALTKITIPSKVKKIGKQSFNGCAKLKNITIKTTKLTTKNVGSKAFKGIHKKATIKVPKSKVKAYKKMLKAKGIGEDVKVKK